MVWVSAADAASVGWCGKPNLANRRHSQVFHVPAAGSTWAESPVAETAAMIKIRCLCKVRLTLLVDSWASYLFRIVVIYTSIERNLTSG